MAQPSLNWPEPVTEMSAATTPIPDKALRMTLPSYTTSLWYGAVPPVNVITHGLAPVPAPVTVLTATPPVRMPLSAVFTCAAVIAPLMTTDASPYCSVTGPTAAPFCITRGAVPATEMVCTELLAPLVMDCATAAFSSRSVDWPLYLSVAPAMLSGSWRWPVTICLGVAPSGPAPAL